MLERVGEDPRPLSGAHVLILQQVGVTKRQVIAAWLSGIGACLHVSLEESDQPWYINSLIFLSLGYKLKAEEVIRHTTVNLHHVKAISLQRYTYSKLYIFYTFFYVIC